MALFNKHERKNKKTSRRDEINELIGASKKWHFLQEKYDFPFKRIKGQFIVLSYFKEEKDGKQVVYCYALDLNEEGTFASKVCILNSPYWSKQSEEKLKSMQGIKVRFENGKIFYDKCNSVKRAEKLKDMVLSYKHSTMSLEELKILRNMYDNAYALINEEVNLYANYLNDDVALALLKEREVDLISMPLSTYIEKWEVVFKNYYKDVLESMKIEEERNQQKEKEQAQKMRDEMIL